MLDGLSDFFKKHPFWAIFIIVFMVLPIIGAVMHIVLKALGKKGIDNTSPEAESTPLLEKNEKGTSDSQ
jgi:hypothetical protein